MKNQEGRRTSHSYGSRTHGPRKTTHGTSGKRPWWRGSSRRSIFPLAGYREEVCWRSRSWKRGGGGIEARSRKRVLSSRVSRHREYIGEGGSQGGHQGSRCPPVQPDPRPRQVAAGVPGGGPLAPPRCFRKVP